MITGLPRPFREPGIQVPDPLPAGAPATIPRFDANPERLRVDSDAQPGAAAIDVPAGAVITGLVGVVDYAFRTYTILPDAGSATVASAPQRGAGRARGDGGRSARSPRSTWSASSTPSTIPASATSP